MKFMISFFRKKSFGVLILVIMTCFMCGCSKNAVNNATFEIPEGAVELEAWITDVKGDAEAIVTIISDDGFYVSGLNLNVILGKRNLKGTIAGAITFVDPHLNDWKKIIAEGNLEMVSHSYDHVRMDEESDYSNDKSALKHEIMDADKWFENQFGMKQIVFVCPENQMCDLGYEVLMEGDFWAVRRGDRGYNSLTPEEGTSPGQWFNLMVQGICDDGVDLDVRNHWIDTAIEENKWLIEMWHNVTWSQDGFYQTILVPEAEEHLDYVAEKASEKLIWNAKFSEAVKYLREKQNAKLRAYLDGDDLRLFVEFVDPKMNFQTFDQPLTVKVILPDGRNAGKLAEVQDQVLMTEVVPGKETVIRLNRE